MDMPLITVNERSIDQQIWNNSKLVELMNEILTHHTDPSSVITAVEIDGHTLSIGEEERLGQTSVDQFQHIHFTVRPSVELAFEALSDAPGHVEILISRIE